MARKKIAVVSVPASLPRIRYREDGIEVHGMWDILVA